MSAVVASLRRFVSNGQGSGGETAVRWSAVRILLALAAFYTAYRGVLLFEGQEHITRAIIVIIVAVLLLVAASWRMPPESSDEHAAAAPANDDGRARPLGLRSLRWAHAWWGLLIAAIGLALAFRLHQIDSQPFGIWFDEAQIGLVANQILDDSSYRPIFIDSRQPLPAFFFYVFAGGIKVLGSSVTSLRAVTTAAGILTVLMLYPLAREMFGHRVAVIATFLLAVMSWHLTFSRFAVHGIFAPMSLVAMLFFLVRGLKGKGAWNFYVAGAIGGIGLQSYFSFLLAPFVVAFLLLHYAVFQRVLPWRQLVLGAAAMAIVAAVVYSPVAIWALRNQDEFTRHAQSTSITEGRSASEVADIVYESSKTHLLMFNSAGDRNGRHNLPGAPMLDRYTGFLLILGAGLALWRWRSSWHFLLIIWVVVMLQGGIWSSEFEAPQAYRTLAVTPAIAILAALPLGLLWNVAVDRGVSLVPKTAAWSVRAPPISMVLVAVMVTGFVLVQAGRLNYDRFFNEELTDPAGWQHHSTDVTFVGQEIDRLGPEFDYRLSTLFAGQPTLQFVVPDFDTQQFAFDWVLDVPSRAEGPTAYFFDATKEPFFRWLSQLYPLATVRTLTPPAVSDPVIVYEVVVDQGEVEALRGLDATYTPDGAAPFTMREAALDLDWSFQAPGALPLEAVWSGFIEVPAYREYTLVLDLPGSARISLDGELVAEGNDRVAFTQLLYKGEHELLVEATVEDFGFVRLMEDEVPLSREAYFAYGQGGHGLLASFYPNENLEGPPVHVELDALVGFRYHAELPGIAVPPFSVRWQGLLDVPVPGIYVLELETFDEGAVMIDGRLHVVSGRGTSRQDVDLSEGLHEIEVTFSNTTGFSRAFLYWTPPGEERQVIPPQRLTPR